MQKSSGSSQNIKQHFENEVFLLSALDLLENTEISAD
jgi:hypothetical protein